MENFQESLLSRIHSTASKHAIGGITAFRSERTESENKANNHKLLATLLSSGFSVTKIKGSYLENYGTSDAREVKDESFFVANTKVEGDDGGELERELIKLGRFFDQDSVFSVRFAQPVVLIGTSKRDKTSPSYDVREQLGKIKTDDTASEFFSRIRGRKFAFESSEEIEKPPTYFGKWAMSIEAKNLNAEISNSLAEESLSCTDLSAQG